MHAVIVLSSEPMTIRGIVATNAWAAWARMPFTHRRQDHRGRQYEEERESMGCWGWRSRRRWGGIAVRRHRATGPGGGAVQGLQGHHQARCPRFGSRLGAVHAEEGARRRAEHPVRAVRRHRLAAWSPYGGRINMPTLRQLAENGLTLHAVAHGGAVLADPVHAADRPQPHLERHGRDHRGVPTDSRARAAASRRRPPPSRRSCRTTATARSGWARTTTCRSRMSPPAASRKTGRSVRDSSASTASSAARPTSGIPDLVEDNHFIEPPYGPEQGYHLSKDLADQAIKMIRDQKASNPSKPWFMWLQPGRQPRPAPRPAGIHRQVQGQVRRRLRGVSHLGAGAHDREGRRAEGHEADADQPDAGVAGQSRPTPCGRGTR